MSNELTNIDILDDEAVNEVMKEEGGRAESMQALNSEDCRIVQTGDAEAAKAAKERIVIRNEKMVRYWIRRYSWMISSDLEEDDLYIAGSMGLVRAAETYRSCKSSFMTYASMWIRQIIMREYDNVNSTIRIPVNTRDTITRLTKKYGVLAADPKFVSCVMQDKSLSELQKRLIMNARTVMSSVSLDQPISIKDDETGTLSDILESECDVEKNAIDKIVSSDIINIMASRLNPREAWVIMNRFGLGGVPVRTLDWCGKHIEGGPITRERIRRIEEVAKRKLRGPLVGYAAGM